MSNESKESTLILDPIKYYSKNKNKGILQLLSYDDIRQLNVTLLRECGRDRLEKVVELIDKGANELTYGLLRALQYNSVRVVKFLLPLLNAFRDDTNPTAITYKQYSRNLKSVQFDIRDDSVLFDITDNAINSARECIDVIEYLFNSGIISGGQSKKNAFYKMCTYNYTKTLKPFIKRAMLSIDTINKGLRIAISNNNINTVKLLFEYYGSHSIDMRNMMSYALLDEEHKVTMDLIEYIESFNPPLLIENYEIGLYSKNPMIVRHSLLKGATYIEDIREEHIPVLLNMGVDYKLLDYLADMYLERRKNRIDATIKTLTKVKQLSIDVIKMHIVPFIEY